MTEDQVYMQGVENLSDTIIFFFVARVFYFSVVFITDAIASFRVLRSHFSVWLTLSCFMRHRRHL